MTLEECLREEGIEQGVAHELKQVRQMVSKRLLNQGVAVDEIAASTGLSVEEISALKK